MLIKDALDYIKSEQFDLVEYYKIAKTINGENFNKFDIKIFDKKVPNENVVPDGLYKDNVQVYNNKDFDLSVKEGLQGKDALTSEMEFTYKIENDITEEKAKPRPTASGTPGGSYGALISDDELELHEYLKQFG